MNGRQTGLPSPHHPRPVAAHLNQDRQVHVPSPALVNTPLTSLCHLMSKDIATEGVRIRLMMMMMITSLSCFLVQITPHLLPFPLVPRFLLIWLSSSLAIAIAYLTKVQDTKDRAHDGRGTWNLSQFLHFLHSPKYLVSWWVTGIWKEKRMKNGSKAPERGGEEAGWANNHPGKSYFFFLVTTCS